MSDAANRARRRIERWFGALGIERSPVGCDSTGSAWGSRTSPTWSPTSPRAGGCCVGPRSATCWRRRTTSCGRPASWPRSRTPTCRLRGSSASRRSAAGDAVSDVPLVLMEFIDGQVVDTMAVAESLTPQRRRAISDSMPRTLAKIHAVDLDRVGLADLASHKPYAQRQLKRWAGQWEQSKTRELPDLDDLTRRLVAAVPEQTEISLVHGDFHLRNVIVSREDGRRCCGRGAGLGAVDARRSVRGHRVDARLLGRAGGGGHRRLLPTTLDGLRHPGRGRTDLPRRRPGATRRR